MRDIVAAVEEFQLYAARQPKLDRLVALHVQARQGELVDSAKDADTVFSVFPLKAKGGRTVVAATQPRQVASALLPSPKPLGVAAQERLEAQEADTLPAASPVKTKAKRR